MKLDPFVTVESDASIGLGFEIAAGLVLEAALLEAGGDGGDGAGLVLVKAATSGVSFAGGDTLKPLTLTPGQRSSSISPCTFCSMFALDEWSTELPDACSIGWGGVLEGLPSGCFVTPCRPCGTLNVSIGFALVGATRVCFLAVRKSCPGWYCAGLVCMLRFSLFQSGLRLLR